MLQLHLKLFCLKVRLRLAAGPDQAYGCSAHTQAPAAVALVTCRVTMQPLAKHNPVEPFPILLVFCKLLPARLAEALVAYCRMAAVLSALQGIILRRQLPVLLSPLWNLLRAAGPMHMLRPSS